MLWLKIHVLVAFIVVLLAVPLPRGCDTNGAEWGESELNILGLAAASLAGKFIGGGDKNDPDFKAAKKIAKRLKKNL